MLSPLRLQGLSAASRISIVPFRRNQRSCRISKSHASHKKRVARLRGSVVSKVTCSHLSEVHLRPYAAVLMLLPFLACEGVRPYPAGPFSAAFGKGNGADSLVLRNGHQNTHFAHTPLNGFRIQDRVCKTLQRVLGAVVLKRGSETRENCAAVPRIRLTYLKRSFITVQFYQ